MEMEVAVNKHDVYYHEAVRTFKRAYLVQKLAAHGGNRTRTAQAIGLQRTYLLRLLREFGLNQPGNGRRKLKLVSVSNHVSS